MQKKLTKTPISKLPSFPDEETSLHWIWPPLLGSDILQTVLQHTLHPSLRKDEMWIITVQDQWRCLSKNQWHYTSVTHAQEALRAQIRLHLQGSLILSPQRCVVIAQGMRNSWYLWQIIHTESLFAPFLKKALQVDNFDVFITRLLEWITQYTSFYQQCSQYPLQLDFNLENVGIDSQQQFVYLGPLEAGEISQNISLRIYISSLKQIFTESILPNLHQRPFSVETIIKKLEDEQRRNKNAISLTTLLQLFVDSRLRGNEVNRSSF